MPRVALVCALLVSSVGFAGDYEAFAAGCEEGEVTRRLDGATSIVNRCELEGEVGPAPVSSTSGGGGSPVPAGPPLVYKPFVEVGGDEPCVAAVAYGPEEYGVLGDGSPDLGRAAVQGSWYAGLLESYLDGGYAPCAGTAVPPITPRLWAESWVREQVLPAPVPRIGAGRFVVGLEAFLETGTSLRLERIDASPFGSAVLSLRSDVVVDWGDGRDEDGGPFTSVGGPYPDGDIRHVFQRSGFYDVVVTQRWTLDWSVGGSGGTITGVETSGTLEDFEVFSVEAVITDTGPAGPTATIPPAPGE